MRARDTNEHRTHTFLLLSITISVRFRISFVDRRYHFSDRISFWRLILHVARLQSFLNSVLRWRLLLVLVMMISMQMKGKRKIYLKKKTTTKRLRLSDRVFPNLFFIYADNFVRDTIEQVANEPTTITINRNNMH